MSSVSLIKPVRIFCAGVSLVLAWSCTVADKGDYTFTDNPGSGGATGGTKGGSSGSGTGAKAGAGGKVGIGGRAAGGRAGKGQGAEGGTVAVSEGGAAGAAGGEAAGEAGASAGEGGAAGQGGAPGTTCDPNPCVHGTCTLANSASGFSCACDAGYEGPRCAVNHDDCSPMPCLNGGTCTDRVNDFKCDCNGTGYSGTTCQTAGPCVANPCLHGGVCTTTGATTYTCDCTSTGYEGTTCQTNHNDCTSSSCAHGTCVDGVNGFTCDCTGSGYEGTHCETNHNDCTSSSCTGVGGTCVDLVNGFKCACATDADCGGAVLSCDPTNLVCRTSITKYSEGTLTWPDDACGTGGPFGQCDSSDPALGNIWALAVCKDAGWTAGVWTGVATLGCANGTGANSMWCNNKNPCDEQHETGCQSGDQTVIQFTCSR